MNKKKVYSKEVSIIIVNYNTKDYLRNCLNSVFSNKPKGTFEVIVVDNRSCDGSAEMIQREFPEVKLIQKGTNVGFATANNEAIGISNGHFILLLNPDTVILDNAIEKSLNFLKSHPDIGIVGCKILNPDGSLQLSCRAFPSLFNFISESFFLYKIFKRNRYFGNFYMTNFDYGRVKDVDVVRGAFLMIRRETIEDIGPMDERFFMYTEETDWCYRTKKAGWRVCFFPDAEIVHFDGKSANREETRMFIERHRTVNLFIDKYFSGLHEYLMRLTIFLGVLLRAAFWYVRWKAVFSNSETKKYFRNEFLRYKECSLWYLNKNRQIVNY